MEDYTFSNIKLDNIFSHVKENSIKNENIHTKKQKINYRKSIEIYFPLLNKVIIFFFFYYI